MKKKKDGFFRHFKDNRVTTVAAAWVYYFLTALLPIVFLTVTAFGAGGLDLTDLIVAKLPEEFRQAGEIIVDTAKRASHGITVFFIITVVFSGSALFNQMIKDGEFFYGVRRDKRGGLIRRLFALVALGTVFVIFLAAAFVIAFGDKLLSLAGLNADENIFLKILSFSFLILLIYVIIIALNKIISPVKLKFYQLTAGGFVALCIIVLGSLAFMLYLRFFANYNKFYGSLAAIIIFLLWAYIVMTGLATGAVTCNYLYKNDKKFTESKNA